jgi:uncharacterized protein
MTAATPLTVLRYDEPLVVVRLGAGADLPDWASSATLFSVTATATETSLVCGARGVPRKAPHQGPFTAFAVARTSDLDSPGFLPALLTPIAEAQLSVRVVSTFDADWVLVPTSQAAPAAEAWRAAGHTVREAGGPARPGEGS